MSLIEFISPGMYTSIQDLGRPGMAFYAIPRSGALDLDSLRRANIELGQFEGSPVIEMNILPPKIKFNSATTICISGADLDFKLNGEKIKLDQRLTVKEGALLTGGPSPLGGARAYLAIRGRPDIPSYYGSVSSSQNAKLGFNQGGPFKKGDTIQWHITENQIPVLDTRNDFYEPHKPLSPIRIKKGPEFDWLEEDSFTLLSKENFKIHPDSNRMGARIIGPALTCRKTLSLSVPVLPGFIQLTSSGQLIVLLNEAQTAGGYPRIAYLDDTEISRFSRLAIMQPFKFELKD